MGVRKTMIEIKRKTKILYYINDVPYAPVICGKCNNHKWISLENMETGHLEYYCLVCHYKVNTKLRVRGWDVL